MRVKSLGKDGNDFNQLRNHRMEHYGFAVSNEFYQPSPFFWNREGCDLPLMGHYRGSSIFMICNGPSLVNGKYDLTKLKRPGVMTYGMNNGARTIRPNFWTCVDDPKRFLKSIWFDPCITKIVPHSFAEKRIFDNEKWADLKTVVGECPNVYYFHRNEKFMANRWLYEDTINWGNHKDHGGGRSVMLAALKVMFLLGFRNVFMMGADFKMTETQTYHFDEQRSKGAVNGNTDTYQKLMHTYFPELKPYFEAEGFNVYNCNPESELKVFDYVPFDEAIDFATANLGDVDNERTWGMYSKPEERQKWINEPDTKQKAHLKTINNRPQTPIFTDMASAKQKIEQQVQNMQKMQTIKMDNIQRFENIEEDKINIPVPKSKPFNSQKQQMGKPMVVPNVVQKPIPNQFSGNKIIRSVPCGGGISFGSSGSQNITIPDNGK